MIMNDRDILVCQVLVPFCSDKFSEAIWSYHIHVGPDYLPGLLFMTFITQALFARQLLEPHITGDHIIHQCGGQVIKGMQQSLLP